METSDIVKRAIESVKELQKQGKSTAKNVCIKTDKLGKKAVLSDKFLLRKLGNGNVAKGKKRFNQLLKRQIYWTYELEEYEIEALLTCGYVQSNPRNKNKRFLVRNERGFFEYVLCMLPENESMQHMRDKEFIASLNRKISDVEWIVPKTQNRIDVVFNLNGKRIGIEVQNSSLEYSRLQEKIELLENHFDQWFFIASKNFADNYYYLGTNKGKVTEIRQVGRTNVRGDPVARERNALNDIRNAVTKQVDKFIKNVKIKFDGT